MSSTNLTTVDQRPVFFFDVDDCLYPRSLGVGKLMYDRLEQFVMNNLSLTKEEAYDLNMKYFEEHTMTVVGLHKLHGIDPLAFNKQNDDTLPMDTLLSPDKELRNMLQRFDPSKVKLWLFTNAYKTHGERVVKLLGVDDLFEGMWPLKPHPEMFIKAEKDAGAAGPEQCYFVDDSARNCKAALARGWQVVRIKEPEQSTEQLNTEESPYHEIHSLHELHDIYPQFSR